MNKQTAENLIYETYRTHYETFGPVWRKSNEGPELAYLWSVVEEAERG